MGRLCRSSMLPGMACSMGSRWGTRDIPDSPPVTCSSPVGMRQQQRVGVLMDCGAADPRAARGALHPALWSLSRGLPRPEILFARRNACRYPCPIDGFLCARVSGHLNALAPRWSPLFCLPARYKAFQVGFGAITGLPLSSPVMSLLPGFIGGAWIWGVKTPVSDQVNLYVFARTLMTVAHDLAEREVIPATTPIMSPFRWFGAITWAMVMWQVRPVFCCDPQLFLMHAVPSARPPAERTAAFALGRSVSDATYAMSCRVVLCLSVV